MKKGRFRMATKRKAPSKVCPKCSKKVHVRVSACTKCGYAFVKVKAASPKKVTVAVKMTASFINKGGYSVADIMAAQSALKQLGGAKRAKQLLDVLA